MTFKKITAEEAASFVNDNDNVGFSGFTPAGCPKSVPKAIAVRAEEEHQKGNPFSIGIYTGASTGDNIDGTLARAKAVKFRTAYQSNKDMRDLLNSNGTHYFDLHLSELPQAIRYGFVGKVNVAVIEATDVTDNGEIILTDAVGISPTVARLADKIIVELNRFHPQELRGMHDIYEPADPPLRREIPVYKPSDRIGTPYLKVDPKKIVGVVETNIQSDVKPFTPLDDVTLAIGKNVSDFLVSEIKAGRIPSSFLPVQSGVGNVANAVLGAMGDNREIPAFNIYTEVIQESVIKLMNEGRVSFASGCSLTVTHEILTDIYARLPFFKDKILLRPQEITNNPEVVRRMGIITINTALEADIFGNINSTHVLGTKMMNGLGGSGDFTRAAYLSIFTTPSTAKNGNISAIVPMVSHLDHTEHSVKIIITEHGVADLRCKSPIQRARTIIDNCVDPCYRPLLNEYLNMGIKGQTPQNLNCCFAFHQEFAKSGDMRKVDWKVY